MMIENFLWMVHKKEPGLPPVDVFSIDMKIEISGAFFSVLHRMHFVSENNANFAFKLIEKSMQRIYLIRRQANEHHHRTVSFFLLFICQSLSPFRYVCEVLIHVFSFVFFFFCFVRL